MASICQNKKFEIHFKSFRFINWHEGSGLFTYRQRALLACQMLASTGHCSN